MTGRKQFVGAACALLLFLSAVCLSATGCKRQTPSENTAVIAVTGDLMVHTQQLLAAYDKTSGTFDFSSQLECVKDILSRPDVTMANLETTFGGEGAVTAGDFVLGYSSYPLFNSPDAFADAVREAGIDLVSTANNHALDSGEAGLERTLDILEKKGIVQVGTCKGAEEAPYLLQEINGVRIGVLAYTYGTNGRELPQTLDFHSLESYDPERVQEMLSAVQTARNDTDFVIMLLHAGTEYEAAPAEEVEMLADQLLAAGCDCVMVSHPHVLQPFSLREIHEEDGTVRTGFVIFSLGNFLSSQFPVDAEDAHTEVGVVVQMTIQKEEAGTSITELCLIPTCCVSTEAGIQVQKLADAENPQATEWFEQTFWPEEYECTIEDGAYIVQPMRCSYEIKERGSDYV